MSGVASLISLTSFGTTIVNVDSTGPSAEGYLSVALAAALGGTASGAGSKSGVTSILGASIEGISGGTGAGLTIWLAGGALARSTVKSILIANNSGLVFIPTFTTFVNNSPSGYTAWAVSSPSTIWDVTDDLQTRAVYFYR